MHNNNKVSCSFRSTLTVSAQALALRISLASAIKAVEPLNICLLMSYSGAFAVASETPPLPPGANGGRYVSGL